MIIIRRSLLVLFVLALPALAAAQVVGPTSLLEWDQTDATMAEAAAFRYEASIDGGPVFTMAQQVCGNHPTVPNTAVCYLPFPWAGLTRGTHTISNRAIDVTPETGGTGPFSAPFTFQVPSIPTAPINHRIRNVPGGD